MADIILVTGGNRSGKSDYAQTRAEATSSRRIFVATAPSLDEEMAARIDAHRAARDSRLWHATVECQTELGEVFAAAEPGTTLVVDSLGMWINNLLYANPELTENALVQQWEGVLRALDGQTAIRVIFVGDEVGCGLISESRLARRFADLNGRINTLVAARAVEVIFLSCGLPLTLKRRGQPLDISV